MFSEVESGRRVVCVFFFFFQAEDGIRDTSVTGVQTCALPTSRRQSLKTSDVQDTSFRYEPKKVAYFGEPDILKQDRKSVV